MILDGHIHLNGAAKPIDLSRKMTEAGVDGGIILSLPPEGHDGAETKFQDALSGVLELCSNVKNTYPVYWIDPLATKALEKVDEAVKQGIAGFKIIHTEAEPGDPLSMEVYRRIAHHNKPILFHSGILWNKGPSSNFNRPANFECLMEVEGLRFALAHISWPWCDECIAVFGKIQMMAPDVKMYVDITPGTPEIYRKNALYKLLNCGYQTSDRVIFGSDNCAEDYDSGWAAGWIRMDKDIYNRLSVTREVQSNIFEHNLVRFIKGE